MIQQIFNWFKNTLLFYGMAGTLTGVIWHKNKEAALIFATIVLAVSIVDNFLYNKELK